jgi:3-hydroxyacyl-[acyl-carrier-protein] dehydratase
MTDTLDSDLIRAILPHRFPMLLVDRIVELEPGVRAVGIKNVTANEQYFMGHFPAIAVMPGVFILEAMAQVAGIMIMTCPEYRNKIPMIGEVESARFFRPVVPGDTLRIEATKVWVRSFVGKVVFAATVDGQIAVKGQMKFVLKDPPPSLEERLNSLEFQGV